jgi:thioesterase domain-containing protein
MAEGDAVPTIDEDDRAEDRGDSPAAIRQAAAELLERTRPSAEELAELAERRQRNRVDAAMAGRQAPLTREAPAIFHRTTETPAGFTPTPAPKKDWERYASALEIAIRRLELRRNIRAASGEARLDALEALVETLGARIDELERAGR